MDQALTTWREVLAAVDGEDGIEVRPPAGEDAIVAFEAARGVALPAPYRRFLAEVADGLVVDGNPALYGLADLAVGAGDGDPTAPFPYGEDEARALAATIAALPAGTSMQASPDVMGRQRRGRLDGCLTITSGDGNSFTAVVVTGPQRGALWRTGEVDAPEIAALYGGDDVTPLGFFDWLARYANDMLGISLDPAAH